MRGSARECAGVCGGARKCAEVRGSARECAGERAAVRGSARKRAEVRGSARGGCAEVRGSARECAGVRGGARGGARKCAGVRGSVRGGCAGGGAEVRRRVLHAHSSPKANSQKNNPKRGKTREAIPKVIKKNRNNPQRAVSWKTPEGPKGLKAVLFPCQAVAPARFPAPHLQATMQFRTKPRNTRNVEVTGVNPKPYIAYSLKPKA